MRRAAAALLLVAVAAVGLRAGGVFSAAGSQEILGLSEQAVYWIIAAAEVILALAGIALLIARMIWARKNGKPPQRRRRSLWWVLLLPLIVFGLARILQRVRQHAPAVAPAAGHAARADAGATGHLRLGNPWPLLVLFAVVAIAAAALSAYRRRRTAPLLPEPEPDSEPDAEAAGGGACGPVPGYCTRTPTRAPPSSAATRRWNAAWPDAGLAAADGGHARRGAQPRDRERPGPVRLGHHADRPVPAGALQQPPDDRSRSGRGDRGAGAGPGRPGQRGAGPSGPGR